jgi:hypothetical protein
VSNGDSCKGVKSLRYVWVPDSDLAEIRVYVSVFVLKTSSRIDLTEGSSSCKV